VVTAAAVAMAGAVAMTIVLCLDRPLIHLNFSEQSLAPTPDGMVERRGRSRLVAISAGDRIELASAAMAKHREVWLSVGCSTRFYKRRSQRVRHATPTAQTFSVCCNPC
jgi:hypothetical protein